jgi:hypothetical protein
MGLVLKKGKIPLAFPLALGFGVGNIFCPSIGLRQGWQLLPALASFRQQGY